MSPRPVYSICFPLVKEKTGYRKGPRYRLVPDKTGLHGARACAADMVGVAMLDRDHRTTSPAHARINRLHMRISALWARVFAGHIESDDARLLAAHAACRELMKEFMAQSAAA